MAYTLTETIASWKALRDELQKGQNAKTTTIAQLLEDAKKKTPKGVIDGLKDTSIKEYDVLRTLRDEIAQATTGTFVPATNTNLVDGTGLTAEFNENGTFGSPKPLEDANPGLAKYKPAEEIIKDKDFKRAVNEWDKLDANGKQSVKNALVKEIKNRGSAPSGDKLEFLKKEGVLDKDTFKQLKDVLYDSNGKPIKEVQQLLQGSVENPEGLAKFWNEAKLRLGNQEANELRDYINGNTHEQDIVAKREANEKIRKENYWNKEAPQAKGLAKVSQPFKNLIRGAVGFAPSAVTGGLAEAGTQALLDKIRNTEKYGLGGDVKTHTGGMSEQIDNVLKQMPWLMGLDKVLNIKNMTGTVLDFKPDQIEWMRRVYNKHKDDDQTGWSAQKKQELVGMKNIVDVYDAYTSARQSGEDKQLEAQYLDLNREIQGDSTQLVDTTLPRAVGYGSALAANAGLAKAAQALNGLGSYGQAVSKFIPYTATKNLLPFGSGGALAGTATGAMLLADAARMIGAHRLDNMVNETEDILNRKVDDEDIFYFNKKTGKLVSRDEYDRAMASDNMKERNNYAAYNTHSLALLNNKYAQDLARYGNLQASDSLWDNAKGLAGGYWTQMKSAVMDHYYDDALQDAILNGSVKNNKDLSPSTAHLIENFLREESTRQKNSVYEPTNKKTIQELITAEEKAKEAELMEQIKSSPMGGAVFTDLRYGPYIN